MMSDNQQPPEHHPTHATNAHQKVERNIGLMAVMVAVVVSFGGLAEIVPLMYQAEAIEPLPGVKPYPALQLAGRDIYVREGCYNCHSQMVRPIFPETKRYGEYSKPGEFVYDHPFQWGSRRIGPDLAREGVNNANTMWHIRHFRDPQEVSPKSIMPKYEFFLERTTPFADIPARVKAMKTLGVPYSDAQVASAEKDALEQATRITDQLAADSKDESLKSLKDKQVIAMIAYLQRLGTDLNKTAPAAPPAPAAALAAPAGPVSSATPAQGAH